MKKQPAKRKEQRAPVICSMDLPMSLMCAQNFFFLSTHQRHWTVHRADDMCLSDRVCSDASSR